MLAEQRDHLDQRAARNHRWDDARDLIRMGYASVAVAHALGLDREYAQKIAKSMGITPTRCLGSRRQGRQRFVPTIAQASEARRVRNRGGSWQDVEARAGGACASTWQRWGARQEWATGRTQ